ncbi:PP2C family protein-serine/threonine phosphatase [Actinoplanes sp. NPDC051494]|uniref:PP2C family protein-serine/threonine phosphatase n=1 Tax=Actinoplanes sp. NPDC051494 TaxID=3363907 RepID=UPI0037BDA0DF
MTDPFEAAGSLRTAYRRVDWAATPLGPTQTWSPALLGALDLVLNTRFAATLFWGPSYTLLYNEAYVPLIGDKHPHALGATTASVFPEIWDTIGPMLDTVFAGDGAVWFEDLHLLLERHGFAEETYFTYSYSAVHGAGGAIEGAIDIVTETTTQVLGRRRLELLSRLNDQLAGVEAVAELVDRALPVLRSHPADLLDVDLLLTGADAPAGLGKDVLVERTPADGTRVWVRLGDAVLSARLSPHLLADAAYLGFVRLVGSALAQGLDRARARQAERRVSTTQRELAEALQRSLLVPPAQPEHLQVAVRYQPAAEGAQIGGDWYDSFQLPDGRLTVVVGDVTGHDRFAAAAMSQIRNLLRGISYTVARVPSTVLTALDAAMTGFGVDVFATAVLAQFEQDDGQVARNVRTMRWSNAGHPPPLLLSPDGTVQVLERRGEPLLGTRSKPLRCDHTVEVGPGATVVFYTDGLVERRGRHLDDGLRDLTALLRGQAHLDAEQICDLLLDHFLGATEDDVVLTVLHVRA